MTGFLSDIITYVRRIVKTPSNAVITDALIIDYINRFWIMDVEARMQTFDFKTKYQFQTSPGIDKYNMPLYTVQTESGNNTNADISMYPVYQNMLGPVFINGIQMPLYTQRSLFFNIWPDYNQTSLQIATGNGTSGPYTFALPFLPNGSNTSNFPQNFPAATQVNTGLIRGHVDMTGIIDSGENVDPPLDTTGQGLLIQNPNTTTPNAGVIRSTSIYPGVYFTSVGSRNELVQICDTGIFLQSNQSYGLLMAPGPAPFGNQTLNGGYLNSFNITGITQATQAVVTATTNFSAGQTVYFQNVGGMTQLNGNTYTVVSNGGTTITINVNSTAFTAYTTSGTISSLSNVINYQTGIASNVFFTDTIPAGTPIQAQAVYYQTGIPRAVLFYNNTLTFRAPPNTSYLIEIDCYLTPAAFFASTQMVPFAYMCEYIARGAARKILSDTGDVDQFNFYEPLFIEQELLVWKRSQRQFTATRTATIYSTEGAGFQNNFNQSSFGV